VAGSFAVACGAVIVESNEEPSVGEAIDDLCTLLTEADESGQRLSAVELPADIVDQLRSIRAAELERGNPLVVLGVTVTEKR
jgi:hypothetical protein